MFKKIILCGVRGQSFSSPDLKLTKLFCLPVFRRRSVCSSGCPYPNSENILKIFKNSILKNQWSNFNQTSQKACIFGWMGFRFQRVFIKNKIAKNINDTYNLLIENTGHNQRSLAQSIFEFAHMKGNALCKLNLSKISNNWNLFEIFWLGIITFFNQPVCFRKCSQVKDVANWHCFCLFLQGKDNRKNKTIVS